MKTMQLFVLLAICWQISLQGNAANTFFVDPIRGSMAGDGSEANPWSTLQGVFESNLIESQKPKVYPYNGTLQPRNPGAPIQPGDTIKLRDGFHGSFFAKGYFNQETITIEAAEGHTPTLEGFRIRGGMNWAFRGLTVSPELGGSVNTGSIIHFESHGWHGPASNISLENSTIYSAKDSSGWSANDWVTQAGTGIKMKGSHFVIRNNKIKNVDFGINSSGDDIIASANSIENFSGDGIRAGGDRVTFENNSIRWSYAVDGNHDDAIQFFRGGGVAHNDVVLRGNTIVSYHDPAHPLTHGVQGIGSFDGPYVNWLVENNVVITSHHHGISVYGAVDSQILNNTVLDITGEFDLWINVNGSTNTTVKNNLAASFITGGSTGLSMDHNITLTPAIQNNLFVDWINGDLRLKAGAEAIDAGDSNFAPTEDIDKRTRPIGDGIDIGAYEYTLGGDFDSDGDVDGEDFLRLQRGLGLTDGAYPNDGDANADNAVDSLDLGIWQNDFGSPLLEAFGGGPLSGTSTGVPEPGGSTLLLLALCCTRLSSSRE